ncbi:MAG: translation initiation factor IF-2 [Cyclobacteriaceae bacterium]|nr:translation initiation factor IF-2 [Cyclobacteriaceae bacterium]MCH8517662.1 translation initiation factor IF-2 [Cyclobacteriaceae bacterium]
MAEERMQRLSQVARKLNVGIQTIAEFLQKKGFEVESSPNSKISSEQYSMLEKEYQGSAQEKKEASDLKIGTSKHAEPEVEKAKPEPPKEVPPTEDREILIKNLSSSDASPAKEKSKEEPKSEAPAEEKKIEKAETSRVTLSGPKVVGKIDLDAGKAKKKEEPKKEEPKKEEPKKEAPQKEEVKAKEAAPKQEIASKDKKEDKKETTPPVAEKEKEKPAVPSSPAKKEETPEKSAKKEEAPVEKSKEATPPIEEVPKEEAKKDEMITGKHDSLKGLTVLGKIELPAERAKKKPNKPLTAEERKKKKRPRKRIDKQPAGSSTGATGSQPPRVLGTGAGAARQKGKFKQQKPGGVKKDANKEITEKDVQEKLKATLAKMSGGSNQGGRRAKYKKGKRQAAQEAQDEQMRQDQDNKTLVTTEFISANDLASLLDVSVNEVISTCMSLGMFVSINQRLDAESITVIADEFGYDVEFTGTDDEMEIEVEEDNPDNISDRAPIVTIMGHVDHGKTSLLDYIRSSKITSGEAGGITQHIGAYDVMTEGGKRIAFLDTPGHEAFTAMRARGAKVTDVAIIVVAADDNVMPQTKEAINHAQVAGVPIVIAINKMDKPNANPEKVKEELANINILVEDWGGKYQCQEISAKTGQGIDELLEKVLLEAEILELKADPTKKAVGTVIEATLDKGRGYVTTVLVQSGTLKVGDVMLAGSHFGKVKAMFNYRGQKVQEVGPATPTLMLGLDGAPQAGDKFNVMESDREARDVANKRAQILREQSMRTKKHITLDEIGRRLAIGTFKELNVIVKGDVDGSIEALGDSLLKLSTDEVQVNIIHKAVGQISESDVLLASASDAVILGFQVRPSQKAKNLAEKEEIEIRHYSIIYDAINDVKDAMEGMLSPEMVEVITGNIEVRDVFKITKVGTVAGGYVTDGFIKRSSKVRLIREGIVTYTGEVDQLKRFKEDVAEVKNGYECGISIKKYNDIKVGDVIEAFEEKETKRTL